MNAEGANGGAGAAQRMNARPAAQGLGLELQPRVLDVREMHPALAFVVSLLPWYRLE